jgi:hypothetical protein
MFGFRKAEHGVAIFRFDNAVLVYSLDKAKSGVWLAGEFATLLVDASPENLGAAVEQALTASRFDVPHPQDWRNVGANVLVVAGKKSWRALEKGAVAAHLFRDRSGVRITPTRNGGPTGDDRGFHELTDRTQSLDASASHLEVASGVIRALAECS